MKLNALLMCRNQPSLRVLARALEHLGMGMEVCASASEAMELQVHGHYSALVLDFDIPEAAQVARMARIASPQRRPVVFAMIGVLTPVGGAFEAGVNLVLYKPLVLEQVTRSLRAAQGFMRPDRRRSPRHKLEALVYLQCGVTNLPALVLDLSEHGMALQAPEPLPRVQQVPLRFVLPGTTHMVEATGEVIWSDEGGRAGMFFSQLSAASRKYLRDWLRHHGTRKKDAVRVLLQPTRSRRAAASSS
jgi:CheY-like chemotaxis protein